MKEPSRSILTTKQHRLDTLELLISQFLRGPRAGQDQSSGI